MGLRCSLLGHDYGEPEVDREREERGSEVVLTVQTYEECARCSDRHIISENTEITSLTPDKRRKRGVDRVDGTAAPSEGTGTDSERGEPERVASGPNAERAPESDREWPRTADAADRPDEPVESPGGADPTDVDPTDAPQSGTGANTDGGTRAEPNAGTPSEPESESRDSTEVERNVPTDDAGNPIEDGEIIDPDRKPGEWPDPDDVGPPTGDGSRERWPDVDIDRIGGEELTYEESTEPTAETTETDEAADDASTVTDSGTGIASAASAPAPGENPAVDPVNTEFYCPTCSFVAPGDHGSLRPGDICPDCGRGYIGERERQ